VATSKLTRRHAAALAAGHLCRDRERHRGAGAAYLRHQTVARGSAVARVLIGTDFEVRVWEDAVENPDGRAVCYSDIAARINNPKASRAGRRRGRKKSDLVVVPWAIGALGKGGALHRLSLGHHPQAGECSAGKRTGGDSLAVVVGS